MQLLPDLLKKRTVKDSLLLKHGFKEGPQGAFTLEDRESLAPLSLLLTVRAVPAANHLEVMLTDRELDTPYTLHLNPKASGTFVGQVRLTLERRLTELVDSVSVSSSLGAPQTRRLFRLIEETLQVKPENTFDDPALAVLRHPVTGKWFGVFLTVSSAKLSYTTPPSPPVTKEILLLNATAAEVSSLVDGKRYLKGYHMNKKFWYAAVLDDTLPDRELLGRVQGSYALNLKKYAPRKKHLSCPPES